MSQQLINLNSDLKRLRDAGYHIEVHGGHLFVFHVPYVNSKKEVKLGTLISTLNMSGQKTTRPETHVINFCGEQPCTVDGVPIRGIIHSSNRTQFPNGLVSNFSFSNKPRGGPRDYFEKVTTYTNIISAPAKSLDSSITEKPFIPIVTESADSVFKYADTNSGRAQIDSINNRLSNQKIAIVGLGGTGAYILDQIAKTWVDAIDIYDGDVFLNHNAFRSPGAASIEELKERPYKVDYYHSIYSKMRNNIFAHPVYVTSDNWNNLLKSDFIFICIDNNQFKKELIEFLKSHSKTFIDVGMGVNESEGSLLGMIRVTVGSEGNYAHIDRRISFVDQGINDYATNIQIADLNALNAVLAVIKWRKLSGFYQDLEKESHLTYSVNVSHLLNEEHYP